MKYAADFRRIAREKLYGKWKLVILVCVIALFLGGTSAQGFSLELELEDTFANAVVEFAGVTVGSFGGGRSSVIGSFLLDYGKTLLTALAVVNIFTLVIGCIIDIGYKRFHLNLIDEKEASLKDIFQYFYNWKTILIANLLQLIYILIGILLLIVPGILAIFNYSMTSYILAEHPEMSASEAMQKSKEMMKGNRWRLFCLEISFIGWEILCAFTLGIGQLWLIPYKETAITAFYREISETWDEPAEYLLEDTSKQRRGIFAVLLVFVFIAGTAMLLITGLKAIQNNPKDEIVTEKIVYGNQQITVHHVINGDIFSDEFWDNVSKIEYYEGSDAPYVVTDKEALQEIGNLIKNLEHKKIEEKPLMEGGWYFNIYTEDAMTDIWVSKNIIDFNGINYKVPTEHLGDEIRAIIMNNYEMTIHVEEYVVNDFRIHICDKPKETDYFIDTEIHFLTDKERNILQNTVNVVIDEEAAEATVELSDQTERTKAVRIEAEGYVLSFRFDTETCEVIDIRKVVD